MSHPTHRHVVAFCMSSAHFIITYVVAATLRSLRVCLRPTSSPCGCCNLLRSLCVLSTTEAFCHHEVDTVHPVFSLRSSSCCLCVSCLSLNAFYCCILPHFLVSCCVPLYRPPDLEDGGCITLSEIMEDRGDKGESIVASTDVFCGII